jgi:primase-polymerase (primpol)-like protein
VDIISSEARTQTSQNGLSGVPKDLTEIPQWVFWRYVERDSEPTKVPYNPHNNRKADTTDPKTWGTFEQAVIAASAYEGDGVGFVFSEDDTLAGVDLDDCINPDTGAVHPEAQAIINELNSRTEISPSGTGVKVLLHGHKSGPRCTTVRTPWGGQVEMYDHSRFFTVTGKHLSGTPETVCDRPEAFKALYEQFFGSDIPATRGRKKPASGPPLTDDDLIAEAERICGDKFRKLYYDGDTSGYAHDASSARAALIGIVR